MNISANRPGHIARLAAIALVAISIPVNAANKLYPANVPAAVAKSALKVTPTIEWNRLSARPGRNAETWTLDGPALNDLSFYGGIQDGKTLLRDRDKRNKPLPRFSKTMLPTDIVQLFEGSYRIAGDTALFEVGKVEPVTFAGNAGVRFEYAFVQRDEVRRKGEATGAVIGGRLYLISFEAPEIHYFDRDIARYREMVGTARVG